MRLLFVATRSPQSAASLESLLTLGAAPAAVFVDTPDHWGSMAATQLPPLINPAAGDGVLELAAAHGLAAHAGTQQQLQECIDTYRPECVLVSCYPHRISDRLLESVPLGWLNIHPSRLPDYRGISPIFWQLRDGLSNIGVTLQCMNSRFDLGPIMAQSGFEVDDAPDYGEIARRAGRLGAQLFLDYRDNRGELPEREEALDPGSGSHQPAPRQSDFAIDPGWPVARLVRFVRGVRELGPPFLDTPDRRYLIGDAKAVNSDQAVADSGTLRFHCYDGCVTLRILQEETG